MGIVLIFIKLPAPQKEIWKIKKLLETQLEHEDCEEN